MKKVLLVVMLMVANSASANTPFARASVEKIVLHDWGSVLIFFDSSVNEAECGGARSVIVLYPGNQFFEEMFSTIS